MKFTIPQLYATEGIPLKEKILQEKYFKVHLSWFVAERKDDECFGYIQNLINPEFSEWGYFNLKELQENRVERDRFFKPQKFKDLTGI